MAKLGSKEKDHEFVASTLLLGDKVIVNAIEEIEAAMNTLKNEGILTGASGDEITSQFETVLKMSRTQQDKHNKISKKCAEVARMTEDVIKKMTSDAEEAGNEWNKNLEAISGWR